MQQRILFFCHLISAPSDPLSTLQTCSQSLHVTDINHCLTEHLAYGFTPTETTLRGGHVVNREAPCHWSALGHIPLQMR